MKTFFIEEQRVYLALREAGLEVNGVYDVGSSTGRWSSDLSQVFAEAHFYLFEPLFDFKPVYQQRFAKFVKKRVNFHLFKVALGGRDGATEIYSDRAGFSASILPVQSSEFLDEHFTVIVNRLDTLISKHHLPRPDVLKIDVQGAELEVLRGAGILIKEIQIIQAEVWFQRAYGSDTPLFYEVYDFLNGFGFSLMELGGLYYNAKRELSACDAYFVQGTVLERLAPKLTKDSLTMTTNPMFRKRKFWRSFSG